MQYNLIENGYNLNKRPGKISVLYHTLNESLLKVRNSPISASQILILKIIPFLSQEKRLDY